MSAARGHRPERHPAPDWAAPLAYQPAEGTPLLTCAAPCCAAKYHDDEPGRAAHATVFGHDPRPPEPQEDTP